MPIIRKQEDIAAASTADMVESYNAYTGKDIKKFASREAGEGQLARAIMSAEDAAGKLGVPKGKKPVAMTVAELAAAAEAKGKPQAAAAEAQEATPAPAPAKSLRATLKAKAVGEPNQAKAKPAKKEAAGRAPKVAYVEIVPEGGRSKMQPGSIRRAIMDAILGKAKSAKAVSVVGRDDKVKAVSIDELQEDHREPVRGHVLKLIFEGHVRAVELVA